MSDNSHAIARRFIESIPTGALPGELMTDDFTAWTTSSGEMPGERLKAGVGLLKGFFASPMEIEITAVTVEGDRAVVEAAAQGRLVDGEEYRNRCVFVLRLRDGKVARFEEHNNPIVVREKLAPLMQQAMAKAEA
jgi:ketosteroid isomerase-like protein